MGEIRSGERRDGMTRRAVLAGGGAIAGGLLFGAGRASAAPAGRPSVPSSELPIVRNGVAFAAVITPDGASEGVRAAADELVSYVAASSGVTLPAASLPSDPPPADLTAIYVGFAGPGADPEIPGLLAELARDGFLVRPYGDTITIIGANEWGTLNGVHDVLERCVGVDWLMPTDIGDYVPQRSMITLGRGPVRGEPAFEQRMFSPLTAQPGAGGAYPDQYLWAQRHRMQGGYNQPIKFHHNLHTLFPVSEFGETHPEYYPGGKPPAPGVVTGWQPVFTEPGTIEVAVTKIKAYFAANPDESSFSLGVNDSGGFAEADPVVPYYTWVNSVVEQVLADYPGKWFGLLAYHQLEPAPPFPLNSQVVPFFTQDRMAWADPEVEAASKELLETWSGVAAQLGLYDYIYGSPYLVPRVYPHLAQQVYAYAKQIGIVAQYSELYPNWGEGAKPWLRSKLMWNPDQDVDELLQRWYQRAVGEAAAPYLRQYYELWEQFWTERAITTPWFQPVATYQAFNSAGYLNAVTSDDITTSRNLINAVLAHPGTPAQQTRAQKLARAFDYYEASALTYPRDVPPPETEQDALDLLTTLESDWQTRLDAAQRRLDLITEFASDPVLVQPLVPSTYGLVWGAWNLAEFWGIVDYVENHEPSGGAVTDWLQDRASSSDATQFTEFVQMALGAATGALSSLTVNPSFEAGADGAAPPWFLWVADNGELLRSTAQARSGNASVAAHALGRGGPAQTFAVKPGLLASRAYFLAPAGGTYAGTLQFDLNLQNSAGAQLGVLRGKIIPVQPQVGQWFTVDSLDTIPETVNGQTVAKAQYVLILNGFDNDPDVYVDDIVVYQAP
jgi:hypothetical protein